MPYCLVIQVRGLNTLRNLIKGSNPVLYTRPWREGMEIVEIESRLAARTGSPYRTGALRYSIKSAKDKRPFPQWIRVSVHARNPPGVGYPYPRLLEFSRKHRHFAWLITSVQPVWSSIARNLSRIADNIEKIWGRG